MQSRKENNWAALEFEEKFHKLSDCPLSPRTQEIKDRLDRKEAE
jgi:hypothetical protein